MYYQEIQIVNALSQFYIFCAALAALFFHKWCLSIYKSWLTYKVDSSSSKFRLDT